MSTTLTQFSANIAALSIPGINRIYPAPVESIPSAELPAGWVQEAAQNAGQLVYTDGQRWRTLRLNLIIVIAPIAASTLAERYQQSLAIMDAAASALHSADLCDTGVSYTMRQAVVDLAGVSYWGIVIELEGRGYG